MAKDQLLSTSDNPFNPWTEWDQWFAYDMRAGYHTLAYLARIDNSSDDMSELAQEEEYDRALAEILEENINGLYIGVDRPE